MMRAAASRRRCAGSSSEGCRSVGVVAETTDTALKPLTSSGQRVVPVAEQLFVSGLSALSVVSTAPLRRVHVPKFPDEPNRA